MIGAAAALLAGSVAWGQGYNYAFTEYETEDCLPSPIPGTVPYTLGQQSIETNAQVYSAESLVRDVIGRGGYFGARLNNVYGVTSVPTVAVCGNGQQFGTLDLDLFSAATTLGVDVPLGGYKLKLFYAGSVTGSHFHFPDETQGDRYLTSWGYAGLGYLSAIAAPLAPLVSRDDGLQTMAGDFIAGASFSLPNNPELGTLDAGYIYSSGLYTNASSRKLKLFATTMLTDRFALLALLRAGVDDVPVAGEQRREKTGATSLYGQNRVLKAPGALQSGQPQTFQGLLADKTDGIDFSTIHIEQRRIGRFVTVSAALAVRPDIFLHEGSIGLDVPVEEYDRSMGEVMPGRSFVRGVVGVTEMPDLPWYAEEGGRQLYVDFSIMDFVYVRRNAPSTLSVFPYAQGAWEFALRLEVVPPQEDAQ